VLALGVAWNEKYESLRQQLATKDVEIATLRTQAGIFNSRHEEDQKQIVMLREFVKLLRDYIPASAVGNMTVQEALAATADLSGLVLCDAEPAAIVYRDYGGNGAILQTELADDEPLYRAWEPK